MSLSRLALIGSGNLGSAIVRGLVAKDPAAANAIGVISRTGDSARRLAAETGVRAETDLAALLSAADTVVVAFKPQSLAAADPRLAELTAGKLVISVLAGKRLATLRRVFPAARNLVRTMPNTPAAIGAAITPYAASSPLSPADRATVEGLLGALGQHLELDEQHLDACTAISAGGPAFLFEFVAALRDAGIAAGLPAEVSARLAVETILGSARLLARSGVPPEQLRDQVVSPNGTTFAGLQVLAARDLRGLVRDTIAAATRRAGELSQD